MTFVAFLFFELPYISGAAFASVGLPLFLMNAGTAFCLNLASVTLVKNTSSLVLTLSGVVKDIILVVLSVMLHGALVSSLQWVGFSISTVGIFLFNMYKKHRNELNAAIAFVLAKLSFGRAREQNQSIA